MFTRRFFFGTGVLASLAWTKPNRPFQPGDLVTVVTSPPQSSPSSDIARYYEHWRASVGKTARVIYVDEHGSPELSIDEYVIGQQGIVPGFDANPLIGCSISLEPECVALVESSTLSTAEKARLIEDR
jgi:hypothetical protein